MIFDSDIATPEMTKTQVLWLVLLCIQNYAWVVEDPIANDDGFLSPIG